MYDGRLKHNPNSLGKNFILTADSFTAREVADMTGRGISYANEIYQQGYKIEKYGEYWRAYK